MKFVPAIVAIGWCCLLTNAYAREQDPDLPALLPPVHLIEAGQHQQPYMPVFRTTRDGRVGFNFKDPVAAYLITPEKINRAFSQSSNGPQILAQTNAVRFPVSDLTPPGPGVAGHVGMCERPNQQGVFDNPQACGANNQEDCYRLTLLSGAAVKRGSLRRRLWGVPVEVRVTNPKTADARIAAVTRTGEWVSSETQFDFVNIFEPMVTQDGNFFVARIGRSRDVTWRNESTGQNMTGRYDMVYAVAPKDPSRACDVRQWTSLKPLGHAPFDPAVNRTYGFARTPFKDGMGRSIPDNTDLGGSYPWIDSKGDNIVFSGIRTAVDTTSFPASCIPSRDCSAGNFTNNSALMGKIIVGLWTKGKMVLMDNMLNNIDFSQPQMEDSGQRLLDMYRASSGAGNHGSGLIRVGSGRDNSGDPQQRVAGNAENTTFVESSENKYSHFQNLRASSHEDIVWRMSSGVATDEMRFDGLLDVDTVIYSTMTQAIGNDGRKLVQFNGFGQPPRIQNSASPGGLNAPAFGRVLDGRIEPVALGGVHGKGLWLNGRGGRLVYDMPAQPGGAQARNWYFGFYLDPRQTSGGRILMSAPDGSQLRLTDGRSVAYIHPTAGELHRFNLPSRLATHQWSHLGVVTEAQGHRVTFLLDGFEINRFNSLQPLFGVTRGPIFLGANPNLPDARGIAGWIDEFRLIARNPNPEVACNHANGTLVGIQSNRSMSTIANRYPAAAHDRVSQRLTQSGRSTFERYACVRDRPQSIIAALEGVTPLRQALIFPEGPLVFNQPRPDSTTNRYCLSCHTSSGSAGLGLQALDVNPEVDSIDDPRRQPLEWPARVYGNIPGNWLGLGLEAMNARDGLALDEYLRTGD